MTTLIIAEKPSVARRIATVVGARNRNEGYLEGQKYVVTWCMGHLVEPAMPDDYPGWDGRWEYRTLPMIPTDWKWVVRKGKGAAEQLDVIIRLMDRDDVDVIVNACDADREGEGVFRRLLEFHPIDKPMRRLWSTSLTPETITAELASARPLSDYDGLAAAAIGRAKADWLVGFNATRAYVTTYHCRISAGRVQTPTLTLIAARTRAVQNFHSAAFWTIQADMGGYIVTGQRYDEKTLAVTEAMRANAAGVARVTEVSYRDETVAAPRLYDLTTLQRDASDQLECTAEETLAALQHLYEHQLITYPRTESRFITSDLVPQVTSLLPTLSNPAIVGATASEAFDLASADVSRVVDDAKVMGHAALLPTRMVTAEALSKLDESHAAILKLLCLRVLEAVSAPAVRTKAKLQVEIAGNPYQATATKLVTPAWMALRKGTSLQDNTKQNEKTSAAPSSDQEPNGSVCAIAKSSSKFSSNMKLDAEISSHTKCATTIPLGLKPGDTLPLVRCDIAQGATSAPRYYTDATLLSAMANARLHIDDAELARSLAETDTHPGGLGTPATRAAIIERVIDAGYAYRSGRNIIATPAGLSLVECVDATLTTPELTARWEAELSTIEHTGTGLDAFLEQIASYTRRIVKAARSGYTEERRFILSGKDPIALCPRCGKPIVKKGAYYQCISNRFAKGDDGRWHLDGGCGFRMPETFNQKKLTERQAANLLSGKTIKASGFISKKGRKFEAKLHLDEKQRLRFVFDD